MAFTLQDDTGTVADANAYCTVDFFKAYHKDRGNAVSGSGGDMEKAIVKATDALDTLQYIGERLEEEDQTTEWPRECAIYEGIPDIIKEVCAELALLVLQGVELFPIPTASPDGQLRSQTDQVGTLRSRVEYFKGGGPGMAQTMRFPVIGRLNEVLLGGQKELWRV